jgi:hypothetical protein
MAMMTKKRRGNCDIVINKIGNRVTMKCKNLRRPPTAQEILDELGNRKKL